MVADSPVSLTFMERVAEGFGDIAQRHGTVVRVDASGSEHEVLERIMAEVERV